jgi:hypothetical protein
VIGAGRAERASGGRLGEAIHGPGKGLNRFVAPACTLTRFGGLEACAASVGGLLVALTRSISC